MGGLLKSRDETALPVLWYQDHFTEILKGNINFDMLIVCG